MTILGYARVSRSISHGIGGGGIYKAPSFRPNVIVLMIIQCARAT
jgi:hypothetical protein